MKGKKTYLTSIITVIYAISAFFYGAIDINTMVPLILAASGFSSVRHGIGKKK